ncbi:hypothetical protein KAI87_16760 [Myxococcota bacterium]|nr:hypothetical protein [Myxococcota bacterium]
MKILLIVAAILGAGYYTYITYIAETPAAAVYHKFADATGFGAFGQTVKLAKSETLSEVKRLSKMDRNSPYYGGRFASLAFIRLRGGHVSMAKQKITHEIPALDGKSVEIFAIAKICRNSAVCDDKGNCEMCREYQHEVDMCKIEDSWYVCRFSESLIK